jgi:ATP-binding cassette subfamily B protein
MGLSAEIPDTKELKLEQLSFRYTGSGEELVLKDLNLTIPEGKVTAIVGASGSGKTTIVKLLLGFYPPTKGKILLGAHSLHGYSMDAWRRSCGAVMQDGFIFSDTIANNIAPGVEVIDKQQLAKAVDMANIGDYIDSLPLGFNTKIGQEGTGLSQGQKQRLLIARAVYKDPRYLFFDEATNALDANNEKIIMENMELFFKGKTVVVVAHRLSTVMNAHKIVVLDKGSIIEEGTHTELTAKRGAYYELVKNQLELGT